MLKRFWFDVPLWRRILLGLVLGAAVGLILKDRAVELKWLGDVFVRLIRMLVVPLIFVTVVSGVASMADPSRLGRIGGRTAILYFGLMLVASAVGLTVGKLIKPGVGVDLTGVTPQSVGEAKPLGQALMEIVPLNPVASLAAGDTLSVIFFAVLLGLGLLAVGQEGQPLRAVFESASAVMLRLVYYVMEIAPFGVFALIAWVVGTSGPAAFLNVFKLAICVLIGCAFQTLIVHGLLVRLLARVPVVPFFRDIADAVVVALSTSSSSATLPVAMRVAQNNLGVSKTVASTVLPLGVTLSMDGTALYVGLLATFSAQVFGVQLELADYLAIMAVTTLVALGTAPVPSASLFLLAAVLSVIGLGPEQTAMIVGFILPFDRPLDMLRTVPNCTSDLSVSVAVARMEGELDMPTYLAKPVE
ncbi:dicarboxylate/amino acid:cation symporter [uncultured Brevundimonas sp.]|uniref:dicarboxylate/amino acid:cation symporter n=1 Tax=uncultured Brevundimonas sp. TaxID=213418 RepID=UPI002633B766|nr:dicarboxylate/amino acid:cation symporter [uncultured Brevundimonas sp.]